MYKKQWQCKNVNKKKCPKYGVGYCKDVAKVVCNSISVTKCDKKTKRTCIWVPVSKYNKVVSLDTDRAYESPSLGSSGTIYPQEQINWKFQKDQFW